MTMAPFSTITLLNSKYCAGCLSAWLPNLRRFGATTSQGSLPLALGTEARRDVRVVGSVRGVI
jgi:hypothetical protein